MFIQGDLQAVFDALFEVGAIDPVLKLDWSKISTDMLDQQAIADKAMIAINECDGDRNQLISKLHKMETKIVNYIAVEVARELAEFTDRQTLH